MFNFSFFWVSVRQTCLMVYYLTARWLKFEHNSVFQQTMITNTSDLVLGGIKQAKIKRLERHSQSSDQLYGKILDKSISQKLTNLTNSTDPAKTSGQIWARIHRSPDGCVCACCHLRVWWVCRSWSPRCPSGRRWTVQAWASNSCSDWTLFSGKPQKWTFYWIHVLLNVLRCIYTEAQIFTDAPCMRV